MARLQQSHDIDISQLGDSLRASLQPLIILAVLVGVATFGVLSMMTPLYSSKARLEIVTKSPVSMSGGVDDTNASDSPSDDVIAAQVTALQAPDLLLKVAAALKLKEKKEFGLGRSKSAPSAISVGRAPAPSNEAKVPTDDEILDIIRRRLEVYPIPDSSIVIKFASAEKELAAQFVKTLAEFHLENLSGRPIEGIRRVVDNSLQPKIERLRAEVLAAETEAKRFRAEVEKLRGGLKPAELHAQRLAELEGRLEKAVMERGVAQSRYSAVRTVDSIDKIDSLPEVQNSPVIRRLTGRHISLQRQTTEARVLFPPSHPMLKQFNADLKANWRLIQGEVEKIGRKLSQKFRVADARVKNIQREINELKSRGVDAPDYEAKLKLLESKARSKRSELERMQRLQGNNQVRIAINSVPVDVKLVAGEGGSVEPELSLKLAYTLFAMAAVFMLGVATVVAKEIMAGEEEAEEKNGYDGSGIDEDLPTSKIAADVDRTTASPMPENTSDDIKDNIKDDIKDGADYAIAAGPEADAQTAQPAVDFTKEDDGVISQVAARIIHKSQDISGYRTMISGDHQATDVSLAGMRLANELSRINKKVAIVDWNVKGEASSDRLGLNIKAGIFELLKGAAKFEDITTDVPNSDVHYITASNSEEFEDHNLDIKGFNTLLETLDETYDHIIVMSRLNAAKTLFEVIHGCFNTGIIITETMGQSTQVQYGASTFLGYEVPDIDVIHCANIASSNHYNEKSTKAKPE